MSARGASLLYETNRMSDSGVDALDTREPDQLNIEAQVACKICGEAVKMIAVEKAAIICLDEVDSLQLGNFSEAGAFISTACPRIAIDGVADLNRPILTVTEAQVMLGEKRWEEIWGGSYLSP